MFWLIIGYFQPSPCCMSSCKENQDLGFSLGNNHWLIAFVVIYYTLKSLTKANLNIILISCEPGQRGHCHFSSLHFQDVVQSQIPRSGGYITSSHIEKKKLASMTPSPWTPLPGSIAELRRAVFPSEESGERGCPLSSQCLEAEFIDIWWGCWRQDALQFPEYLFIELKKKAYLYIVKLSSPSLQIHAGEKLFKVIWTENRVHFTDINTQPSLPSFITEFSKNTATFGAQEEIALCLTGILPIVSHMSENA